MDITEEMQESDEREIFDANRIETLSEPLYISDKTDGWPRSSSELPAGGLKCPRQLKQRTFPHSGDDMKKCSCDSHEDELAVDVGSEGEGRGEGVRAGQAVALVGRRLLTELLLPGGESLDVHELGASAQRIHPLRHHGGTSKHAHCGQKSEIR